MRILGIETSCDETAAAVVKDGQQILSNIVASQIDFHKKYGGIVPEIASRKHMELINPVIKEALEKAKVKFKNLDAVAVTYGPGLVGALLVGICAAKAMAYALRIPLIGVSHIEGHVYANFLEKKDLKFPFICLIVSGGHTTLILAKDHGKYELLGRTRDDAAGEAFDKVARFLGLGYPGGPLIDDLAEEGNPNAIKFPRAIMAEGYDFSFSGLKTAVVNYVRRESAAVASGETSDVRHFPIRPTPPIDAKRLPDVAASFQQAIVDVLVEKSLRAAREKGIRTIALAGGVSANSVLRKDLTEKALKEGLEVIIPPINLCTDNAAMIAAAGYYKLKHGETSNTTLTAVSSLRIG